MSFAHTGDSSGLLLRDLPIRLKAWLLLAALMVAYAIAFIDRQIIALLLGDIKGSFHVDNAKLGLLQGPAFGILYAVFGLPLGWLADRVHRLRLIVAGMLLWSAMTALGGLAPSFTILFLTRVGVGIGEAALVPAAVSLLADSFLPNERALPLALFTAGLSLGAGLALAGGGAVIAWVATSASGIAGPTGPLAGHAPWQTTLIVVGVLGLPAAGLLALLDEPVRGERAPDARSERLIPYLAGHRALFASLLAGAALLYVFANALAAWLPTLFIRQFGWPPSRVGLSLGPLVLTAALAGNLASGVAARRRTVRGHPDGALQVMTAGAALTVLLAGSACTIASPSVALAWGAASYGALGLCFGVATAALVAVTAPPLRGRMTALYLTLGNLAGMTLGPSLVGFALDYLAAGPRQVGVALSLVGAPAAAGGTVLLAFALRWHRTTASETDL